MHLPEYTTSPATSEMAVASEVLRWCANNVLHNAARLGLYICRHALQHTLHPAGALRPTGKRLLSSSRTSLVSLADLEGVNQNRMHIAGQQLLP
jgi:hypothetical protein